MIPIVEKLYLGNRESARDLRRLREAGVTHVVNCAAELPNYHEGQLRYHAMRMSDPDDTFEELILPACEFIDEGRRQGGVLVHCFAAVSRSPATILAYLCHTGMSLHDAAEQLSKAVWTNPDASFLRQIARFQALEWQRHEFEYLSDVLLGRK